jgi:predicted kinase
MKIIIIGGLPASGKTTLAYKMENKEIFQMDKYRFYSEKDIKKSLNENFTKFLDKYRRIRKNKEDYKFIIEGLFTTNNDVKKLLDYIKTESLFENVKLIEIIWFSENREKCIENDSYRNNRDKKSHKSILKLPYEPIDLSLYDEYCFKIQLIEKEVYIMENWEKFAKKFEINLEAKPNYYYHKDKGEFRYLVGSDTWEISGTWNNCWGHVRDVEPEEACEFKELDELLEKAVPNITYLQYKKISNVVFEEEIDIGDYYSNVTGGCNVCDIKDLYDRLVELSLFDPNELE